MKSMASISTLALGAVAELAARGTFEHELERLVLDRRPLPDVSATRRPEPGVRV
jgi:hypothetical protein